MANVRVYELSRDLDKTNKEILNVAKGLGISVKSHASSISDEEAKRIIDKIGSPGKSETKTQDVQAEEQEKVRVFTSESGAEVVERRKGARVVLRRKKKVEQPIEPEIEQDAATATDAEITEKVVASKDLDTDATELETKTPGLNDLETDLPDLPEESPADMAQEQKLEPEQVEGTQAKEVKPLEGKEAEKDGAKAGTKDTPEEAAKKFKKSKKRVKPKREEIIDGDTLEELRKVFRTKLPGRKREYLVDDRQPRTRPTAGNAQRDRRFNKGPRVSARTRQPLQATTGSAEVIPFPAKPSKRVVKIGESINLGELAKLMSVKAGDLIKRLISLGVKATLNQALDYETATLVAEEFGYEVVLDIFEEEDLLLEEVGQEDTNGNLTPRPPVVTVMGHVDHGKTTLLDSIRNTNVVEGEAGGITQHIGAYSVDLDEQRKVAFVDTPGHEAFTAMRARGAKVTDIVVLVVAADDGVMPQTVEAVNHARAAEVPIIVAVNKIDKDNADTEKIKRQLSEIGLLSEEWGGDTLFAEVSAKQSKGIKELLELILLQADLLELKSDREKRANGFVIEAVLDKGRGPVATVIVGEGTLKVGDLVVAGTTYGKVRALQDDKGNRIKEAGPSNPAEIMGLSGVPEAGERFYVVKNEKAAKEVVGHRERKRRETASAKAIKPTISLENLFETLEEEEIKELALVIKADTQGSVEAVRESIDKLSTEKCQVKVVHTGVGGVNETDVILASASQAIIVGFNVRPDSKALKASEREGVSLELHTIIYNLIDRVRSAMEGLLDPIVKEKITGHAEVRETFHISRIGTIAGCIVNDGNVARDSNVRVIRDGVVVYEGKLDSLRRFKDDVKEVNTGYECGIGIEKFNDIKVGDTFEFYVYEEFKQEL
jgi:translation initiation factor IF-2